MQREIAALFPLREEDSHKGTYGTVLSLCGSYGMVGAALLAARAALRSGAGLVIAAVPEQVYPLMASALPEAVFAPYSDGGARAAAQLIPRLATATALVVGCGLGQSEQTAELVAAVLSEAHQTVVLDADGINLAARHIPIKETLRAPLVLTPHPKELSRLLHCSVEEIQNDRLGAAREAVAQTGGVVVLKGHGTVVASPSGEIVVNTTGNPGMAVGGSGDVLAGIIGGLAAQGLSPFDAARAGVYLHGLAGDRAAARLSQHAMLPSDIIDELGGVFLNLEQSE